ncbi:LPXTG cell wall anchor domain-containing protein [Dorea formicigenerans]|jgi:LPXTG-motif cell wall-anchored protein|uniref:LPXTG-motif cell wall anchor domain protein n=1 Tax=Dorea formicigenerans ATCC 27755 TaxID=411461 RepID=B0G4T3_9FIRM|nr:MBG domain-containing protein [Dorea formicigenerans]EDR47307.1 LPXTG-motif cell wall anchor domain protein [Dorea formicigenerans ATCC 27755]MBT9740820.1 LPXTG cell wall anchor domain-containing protein [Dorea formicigenerans]UWP20283.1 LPXTG cell wall anchor domain-containing protein [Dorea formicigenerans]
MKKRKYKQLLASVIACSMVLSGMPATAYAAGNDTAQEVQSEDQTSGTAGSEDSSSAGQQENAGNQTTAGTNESTSTESDSNSQTNSSQDNTSKNNTAQSGTTQNNTAQSDTTQNNTAQSGTTQNNTASQPAAADAQSAQDAKAVKAGNVLEIHKGETIKGATLLKDFKDWFGAATRYRYKKTASTDDWNEITPLDLSKEYTLASGTVTVEKYIKTGGSWINPTMEWVQAGTFTVKNYSNVTFNVTNIEGAGVKIDGTAVTDTVKSYDTENKTFTVNDVDGYDVTVKNGETPMTPNADGFYTLPVTDATINVVYEATAGAFVNVTNPENGKITIDGQDIASKKVALNSTYTVNVTPDNGYAVENIFVNNNPVEDVTYANQTATVTLKTGDLDNEIFNITAQIVQCKLDVKDAEVSYHNGMSTDKIAQNIFAAVVGTDNVPEITLNDVTIEYDASLTGLGNWKAIGYQPEWYEPTLHEFGKSTEKIRITYKGTDKYPFMQKTVTITLKDLREETTLSINDGIMMKYQSTEMMDAVIKVLIAQNATVTDKAGNKIETTADDFTYTPSTDEWKAGEQEITVTYNGNEDYLSSSATTTITIKKGDAKVWVNSQNIKYGESFSQIFSSDPSDAAPLGMIVGIDGNGKSFVGFDVSNIVIKQKVPVIGTIEVPLEQAILALVPDGKVTVGNLMTVINKLPDLGDNAGIISAVQKVVNQILKIYPAAADWSISFKRPTESGVYLAAGASTSQNYNTAVGVGYLTIAPQSKDVKLEFNSPLPKNCTLTYEEAQEFDFSGKATQNGQTVSANIKTKYVGVTADGKWVSSKGNEPEDALREPGNYVEKIYTVGGNYVAAPIVRCYTVKKAETEIRFDDSIDLEVPYDGQPHGITAGVYHGDERIAEADIIYMSSSGYKSAEKPTDAGMYQVMASYKGDSKYACVDAKYTRLFIKQKVVTVTPNAPQNPIYYRDQLPEFTYTVTDENGKVLSEEEIASLGTVSVVKTPEDVTPGHYTIKAQVENANKNYDITCGDRKFDILARPITIKTMNMAIEYGDDVPDVDYYISDMNGELADPAIVSGADFPSLDFSIEGQDEGKHLAASTTPYAINVSGLDNANFKVTYEGGSLTVNPRKINISIDSKKKVEDDADPELTYTVSRATGEAVAQAVEDTTAASAVVEGDELGVTLTREAGETVGLYDIYANVEGLNSNYALAETPDGTDKFEIVKKGTVIDDNKKPSDQNPSGDKTTVKGDNKNNKNTNTAKKADNTKKNQPKTGDNSHVMFYLFMIEAAMVAAFITLIFRRRRRS